MAAAYKTYDRSQQQIELLLPGMFSTLYENILRLLPNVSDVEWMHAYKFSMYFRSSDYLNKRIWM